MITAAARGNALAALPVLTSVLVVLCSRSGSKVAALPHVVAAINDSLDYIFPQFWSLPRACEANLRWHLPRLAARGITTDASMPYFYWLYQCRLGLVSAVKHDSLAMVEWLHEYCPWVLPYNAMIEAAKVGSLRLLAWLVERHANAPLIPQVMDAAASTGQLNIIQWLHRHPKNRGCTEDAVLSAIRGGHSDTVKWLREHYGNVCVYHAQAIGEAIDNGYTAIMKFLFDLPAQYWPDLALGVCHSAKKGDLKLVQWFYSMLSAPITNTDYKSMDWAASGGHLHVLKWLHDHHPDECSRLAMDNAAKNGSLEVVRWLHENRSEGCSAVAMDNAASKGHLVIVTWLHENRGEGCSYRAMDGAAANGHLHIVKWLHENRTEGCTYRAMERATSGGHLDVVKWLHENRSERGPQVMDLASTYGHLEVVKWLHENRAEGCSRQAMTYAAANGHLEVVKWLHENRNEGCDTNAMGLAALEGRFEVLLFLHANRSEGCRRDAFHHEYHFIKDLEAMLWLAETYPGSVDWDKMRARNWNMTHVLEHILKPKHSGLKRPRP